MYAEGQAKNFSQFGITAGSSFCALEKKKRLALEVFEICAKIKCKQLPTF